MAKPCAGAIGYRFLLHKIPGVANIEIDKTCQGYARKGILKPAGYFLDICVILKAASAEFSYFVQPGSKLMVREGNEAV